MRYCLRFLLHRLRFWGMIFLEATFGAGGIVHTLIGSASRSQAVAVQPDGKIVVAGVAWIGSSNDIALARYLGSSTVTASALSPAAALPATSTGTPFSTPTFTAAATVPSFARLSAPWGARHGVAESGRAIRGAAVALPGRIFDLRVSTTRPSGGLTEKVHPSHSLTRPQQSED